MQAKWFCLPYFHFYYPKIQRPEYREKGVLSSKKYDIVVTCLLLLLKNIFVYVCVFKHFLKRLLQRKTAQVHMWGKEQRDKQTPLLSMELQGRLSLGPWYQALSWSQILNWLSQPGVSVTCLLNIFPPSPYEHLVAHMSLHFSILSM